MQNTCKSVRHYSSWAKKNAWVQFLFQDSSSVQEIFGYECFEVKTDGTHNM